MKSYTNDIFPQMWCWVSWLLNGWPGEWHSPVYFMYTVLLEEAPVNDEARLLECEAVSSLCFFCSRQVLGANALSPTDMGALSVVDHPDNRQCLSFLTSLDLNSCSAGESTSRNVSFLILHSPLTLSVLTFHIHVTICVFNNSFCAQDCLL